MINLAHLLYKNGINNVCISPGLRNTAISLSFIKHGKFNCHSIIDERSAGYFALGIAIKTKKPSVLICTSGTATANYLPAIIEASQSKIPLLIITADRPTNLLNTGCLLFPEKKTCFFDLPWSLSEKTVEHLSLHYENWAKAGSGAGYSLAQSEKLNYISNFN